MAGVKVVNLEGLVSRARGLGENEVATEDLLVRSKLRVRVVASRKGSWPIAPQAEEHVFVVLRGRITFDVAPVLRGKPVLDKVKSYTIGPGQAIVLPPNTAHGGRVSSLAIASEITRP
jgi:mannose-6-phosphate isomerase-like protein (cupin superfamily)